MQYAAQTDLIIPANGTRMSLLLWDNKKSLHRLPGVWSMADHSLSAICGIGWRKCEKPDAVCFLIFNYTKGCDMNSVCLRQLASVTALLFFVCGSAVAWEGDIKRVPIPGGLTAKTLPDANSKGAKLFASYCGQCHSLPSPRMHSRADWPMRFGKMMDHVKLLAGADPGIKIPTGNEKQEIVSYLEEMGFIGLAEYAPLLTKPEGFKVAWYCSACHAVPDPVQFPAKGATQLSAKEWGLVIDRMNAYRKQQGREEMSVSDRNSIVDFLTKNRP